MSSHRVRQFLLFTGVVVLPISAIVVQHVQISGYEDDLARASRQEAHLDAAQQIGQRMLEMLEATKLDELGRHVAGAGNSSESFADLPGQGVVVGVEQSGQLKWPWTSDMPATHAVSPGGRESNLQARFAAARESGPEEARRIYVELVELPASSRDENGVPYWTYAARALLVAKTPILETEILARIVAELRAPVTGLHAAQIRDLLRQLSAHGGVLTDAILDSLTALSYTRSAEFEELSVLQNAYSAMNLTSRAWHAYESSRLWLVGKAPTGSGTPPLVVITDANSVLRRAVPDAADIGLELSSTNGLPLSGRLVGLFVAIPPGSLLETNQVRPDLPSFYEVTVGLSIFLAIFGAYLLWRDVRRENSVAQLRTEFVSGVTHELKTPLTSIRMFAETLQIAEESGVDTAEKRAEYVETIIRESERLTRLLNNVLAFAQIERGERAYYMQSVDLRNVVEEAESMIRLSLEENGMQLEVSIVGDVPVIAADDDAMLQAVLNLLSNAIKYSGKSRRIGLSLYREGSNAVIAVTDHGVGIPGAEQKLIFESFYRVRGGDESQAVSGTGLGLAIVSDIALAHGGSVSVESNVGDGSTFFIRIPVDRDLGP